MNTSTATRQKMSFEIPDRALYRKIKKPPPVVSDFPKSLRKFDNNEKV